MVLKPFGTPIFQTNTRQGELSKKVLRQAVQVALNPENTLLAAFGSPEFFSVDGAYYPEGNAWHTDVDVARYGSGDPEAAAMLMQEGEYDGSPIRILTSRQYGFHHKMAEVAAAYLRAAGFEVDLQVSDWATLTTRRADPALWADVQKTFYEEAPAIKVRNFNALAAKAKTLQGLHPSPWPFFWNVTTERK